jgi:LysR family transcriptional regulator, nitrogen assimilation regulatory protein
MDLKQLRTFIRIAEVGSLSQASDRLGVAQPALSRQIKLLETEIGVPLFARHGRGMRLTEAGHQLLEQVGAPLRQLERSFEDLRSSTKRIEGRVSLGMTPTISFVLAGRFARRVANQLPGVSLRIVEGYGGYLVEWLQRNEIDATVLYGPASDLHFRVTELLFERLVLVGPRDCGLDIDRPVLFRTLANLQLVLPSKPHGLRAVVDNAAYKSKISLNIRFEADSFLVLKDLVQEGLGHTILPTSAFKKEQLDSSFRIAPLIRPKVIRHIVMATKQDHVPSRATIAVGKLLMDETRSLVKSKEWDAFLAQS